MGKISSDRGLMKKNIVIISNWSFIVKKKPTTHSCKLDERDNLLYLILLFFDYKRG